MSHYLMKMTLLMRLLSRLLLLPLPPGGAGAGLLGPLRVRRVLKLHRSGQARGNRRRQSSCFNVKTVLRL